MLKALIQLQSVLISIEAAAVLVTACLLLVLLAWFITRNRLRAARIPQNWYEKRCHVLSQRYGLNKDERQRLQAAAWFSTKRR